MKNKEMSSGITLIALVVTIIVLLILSGISIGMITGENGIIKKAVSAKEDTIVLEEKDTIEKATILAMQKNKYGIIEENELKNELNKIVGTGKIILLGFEFLVYNLYIW